MYKENAPGDVAEQGALGVNGLLVYEALCRQDHPLTVWQLAEQCGLKEHQVYYVLRKLKDFQLVASPNRGFWGVTEHLSLAELDLRVAAVVGKLGRGQARQRKHQEDRAQHATHLILTARRKVDPDVFLPANLYDPQPRYRCEHYGNSKSIDWNLWLGAN